MIQKAGSLSKAETDELVAQKAVEAQLGKERREGRGSKRGCKICGETGHNKRTCKMDVVEVKD